MFSCGVSDALGIEEKKGNRQMSSERIDHFTQNYKIGSIRKHTQ